MSAAIKHRLLIGILPALVSYAGYADDYLGAEQLSAHFSSITMYGTEDGADWEEVYKPNGKIAGKHGGESYRGKWKVENGMLCLDYAGSSEDGCWRVKLGENTIQWFLEDGTADGEDRFEVTH